MSHDAAVVRIQEIDVALHDASLSPEERSKLEGEKASLIQGDATLKVNGAAPQRCPIDGSPSLQPLHSALSNPLTNYSS